MATITGEARDLAGAEGAPEADDSLERAAARRFLRVAAAAFAVVLATCALVNLVVDPNGVWGWRLFPTAPTNFRAPKLEALERAAPFDTVILGDSRAQRMEPAEIRRLTGRRAFNAAMSSSDVLVQEDMLRRALAHNGGRLDGMIWMLGPEPLNNRDGVVRTSLWARLGRLFSGSELDASLDSALDRVGVRPLPAPVVRYAADGHETYNLSVPLDAIEERRPPPEAEIRHDARVLDHHYRKPFDPLEVAAVTRILRRANALGVTPTVILPPYEPREAALTRSVLGAALQRLRDLLRREQRAGLRLRVVDASDPAVFGGRAEGFSDGIHMTSRNLRRLLRFAL